VHKRSRAAPRQCWDRSQNPSSRLVSHGNRSLGPTPHDDSTTLVAPAKRASGRRPADPLCQAQLDTEGDALALTVDALIFAMGCCWRRRGARLRCR
jgi:hypothetical protein